MPSLGRPQDDRHALLRFAEDFRREPDRPLPRAPDTPSRLSHHGAWAWPRSGVRRLAQRSLASARVGAHPLP